MRYASFCILLSVISTLLSLKGTGQSLVPNGDFSAIRNCDSTFARSSIFNDWFFAPGKLKNAGLVHAHWCIPAPLNPSKQLFEINKHFGFHLLKPFTGKGYVGVNLAEDSTRRGLRLLPYQRSILQSRLKRPLDSGKVYSLNFVAYFPPNIVDNIKEVGMAFTSDTLHHDTLLQVKPPLKAPPWFKDTLWTSFSTQYTAHGGEEFISIGSFIPYDTTNKKPANISGFTTLSFPILFLDAVSVYPLSQTRFQIDLPEDTTVCGGDTLVLDPVIRGGIPDDTATTYRWSTGSTDSVLRVTQPGTYWVEVTMNAQFSESDTFTVKGIPALPLVQKPDTLLCPGDSIAFTLPQDTFYTATWRDGFPGLQRWLIADSVYPYQLASACDTQRRSLRIIALICDSVPVDTVKVPEDTIRISDYNLIIPDAFTPNGDGLNEVWDIPGLPPGSRVEVYTRWGERLFFADPYEQPWDGTDRQGKPLPSGTYVYSILHTVDGQGRKRINGVVNIVR